MVLPRGVGPAFTPANFQPPEVAMDVTPATEPLVRLLARAIVAQARRQAQNNSDPGSETTEAASTLGDPPRKETHNAISL